MTAVVFAPLRVERRALSRPGSSLRVVRTGMGPVRAATAVGAHADADAFAVAGVGGGLAGPGRPGDIVVASEVRGPAGTVACPSAPLLTGALRRLGLTVHTGPLYTSDRVVNGARRRQLAGTGAIAVDMESAPVAAAAGGRPFAAVRALVDTADHGLWTPGTLRRGMAALRNLRRAVPGLEQWAAAVGAREVLLAAPRSFCAGVERAIDVVERALDQRGGPVYVRRQIVHNAHVVRRLADRGAVFVTEVDEVPRGATVVLAAHGVAPDVRAAARERDLDVIDATCPLVTKVHAEVRRYTGRGDTVFLIGHRDHEEVEGTVGEAPDDIIVVEDAAAAARVTPRDPARVAYAMQTTLAVDEAEEIAAVLRERFLTVAGPRRDDICYATTNRQQAVRAVARDSDLVLVVGSTNSSNSLRLVEVAEREGVPAHLVDDAGEIDLRWLAGARRIGLTAGASAPPHLVDDIVHALTGLGPVSLRETEVAHEDIRFTLPKEVS
jgi:4-hydroxy-3-methylbut-2-en-1-yl diphosphate reductase